jgi:hypothetical protein
MIRQDFHASNKGVKPVIIDRDAPQVKPESGLMLFRNDAAP